MMKTDCEDMSRNQVMSRAGKGRKGPLWSFRGGCGPCFGLLAGGTDFCCMIPSVTLCLCYNGICSVLNAFHLFLPPQTSNSRQLNDKFCIYHCCTGQSINGNVVQKETQEPLWEPNLRPQDPVTELDRSGLQRAHILRPHSLISNTLFLNNHTVLRSWIHGPFNWFALYFRLYVLVSAGLVKTYSTQIPLGPEACGLILPLLCRVLSLIPADRFVSGRRPKLCQDCFQAMCEWISFPGHALTSLAQLAYGLKVSHSILAVWDPQTPHW